MKVLVVMRVYSGLAETLSIAHWQPRGVPAVYRLLEGLASNPAIEASYIFLARDAHARFLDWRRRPIAPLGDRVWVLPWRPWPLFDRLGLGNALREIEHACRVLFIALKTRPHVAYCTNSAYVAASLLARLRIAPVVLRFLGIFPVHKQMVERKDHALARWFYRAKFARVICTLEGSGAEYYLPKLLRSEVPLDILINGVDRATPSAEETQSIRSRYSQHGAPIITFLGRLESSKGCEEFIEALVRLGALRSGHFTGLVLGEGSLRASLENAVAAADLSDRVHFAGAVPHRAVPAYLAATDVYVSLNRYGNLSNANLEAMIAGRCMLMLAGDHANHIDEVTDRLVPRSIVERISRENVAQSLADALARLVDQPEEIRRRADATAVLANNLLTDWNTRVEREMHTIFAARRAESALRDKQTERVQ